MRRKMGGQRYAALLTLVATAAATVLAFAGGAGAIVAGAGFTTNDPNIDGNSSCLNGPASATPKVNCNLYGSKSFVWINGGPTSGQNSLTDGTYFFAVLDPGGQKDPNDATDGNLSDVSPSSFTPGGDAYTNREFTVSGGKIALSLGSHVTDATYNPPNGLFINLMPYDDTTNPGGVYILAICQLSTTQASAPITGTVTPSACKYDAFKAPLSTCTVNCEPSLFGVVSGLKYYDANANGQFDPGEVGIAGWKIGWTDGASGTLVTASDGTFSQSFTADTYSFAENHPVGPTTWMQTGNTVDQTNSTGGDSATLNVDKSYSVTVVDNGITTGINFGNLCVGAGGGLTLGWYSNKNGQATITAADLAFLDGLNLVNANGTAFNPTTAKALGTWLLGATATNMAYMLSAQLATMELNVRHNVVSGSGLIYAPGTTSANSNGFATVNDVMAEGNTLLGSVGGNVTVAQSALRTHEEAVKTALDKANNNLNFVQSGPGRCPTPVFP
jgi:hypothetical protein